MILNLIYIIGIMMCLSSLLLSIWVIGISEKRLKKIAIFLTSITTIYIINGISLVLQEITGSTILDNAALRVISNLTSPSPINKIQYTIISFLIMLSLWIMYEGQQS